MMCTMTREWERQRAAVKTEREKLGLTQVELAGEAGVTESTIQNLEGQRPYKRRPGSLDLVWSTLERLRQTAEAQDAPRSPAARHKDAVPLRVQHELNDGDIVDTDVIDLSRGGMKLVVVVTRDPEAPSGDPAAMREDFAEWTRVQRALRGIAEGREDTAAG
jgi:transcriptional regulator with XRE-family HTH domain